MKIASIVLLAASSALAAAQAPPQPQRAPECADLSKKSEDVCGESIKDAMQKCFIGCFSKRNPDIMTKGTMPPCPQAAELFCTCSDECLAEQAEGAVPAGCRGSMHAAIDCGLRHEQNCGDLTCAEATLWREGEL